MVLKDWIDIAIKALGLLGVYIAVINYRRQRIIKKGEWLQSLFEKFYENANYKEVRRWLDNDELETKIKSNNKYSSENEEKFTDFLNFFEFIANLEAEKQIAIKDVLNLFDYYLKKIKNTPLCKDWIKRYGFEKLEYLLKKLGDE